MTFLENMYLGIKCKWKHSGLHWIYILEFDSNMKL